MVRRKNTAVFKKLVKATFDTHCESGLYTMKVHLLDHKPRMMRGLEYYRGSMARRLGSLTGTSNVRRVGHHSSKCVEF